MPDGPGVDEEEGPALVPHKLRRFVKKTLEPQSLASLCEVGKQGVIIALPFALELNPLAGHVVGYRLDAGTDQTVLGKILEGAIPHELRGNPDSELKGMLEQGIDAGVRKPCVHRKLHLFGHAERLRRTVQPADVVGRRRQRLSKAAAHVRGEIQTARRLHLRRYGGGMSISALLAHGSIMLRAKKEKHREQGSCRQKKSPRFRGPVCSFASAIVLFAARATMIASLIRCNPSSIQL